MASRANQSKPEEMQQDLQAFESLWSSLRSRYEGTNITKTIAKLLHMYQPEDGIDAYERLLKTISMLLEDFDSNGLRTLVSMVPSPKNVSDDVIKDVFHKSTGFTRIDAPVFNQNQSLIPSVVNPNEDDAKDVEATAPTNVKSNLNVNSEGRKLNYEKLGNNSKNPQEAYSTYRYQNDYVSPQNYQKMNYYLTPQGYQMMPTPMSMSQGYKMAWIPSSYVGNPSIGNSYTDFIVKTEDNKLLRVPVAHFGVYVPCSTANGQSYYQHQGVAGNRHYYPRELKNDITEANKKSTPIPQKQEINSNSVISNTNSNCIKKEKEEKQGVEKNESKIEEESKKDDEEDSLLDKLTLSKNLEMSIDRFINRMKNTPSSLPLKKINNSCPRKLEAGSLQRQDISEQREVNCSRNEVNEWTREMQMRNYDYAAQKRQYYDAVLNFQRAKVQPSSSFTPTAYESSYYEYIQQQQWLYQQHHQRLIMGQYAAQHHQRLIHPEYTQTIRNPYGRPAAADWMAANNCATSRQPQQVAKKA